MRAQVNELLLKKFFQYSVSAGLWRPSTEYCLVADTRPNRVAEPSIGSALFETTKHMNMRNAMETLENVLYRPLLWQDPIGDINEIINK